MVRARVMYVRGGERGGGRAISYIYICFVCACGWLVGGIINDGI